MIVKVSSKLFYNIYFDRNYKAILISHYRCLSIKTFLYRITLFEESSWLNLCFSILLTNNSFSGFFFMNSSRFLVLNSVSFHSWLLLFFLLHSCTGHRTIDSLVFTCFLQKLTRLFCSFLKFFPFIFDVYLSYCNHFPEGYS